MAKHHAQNERMKRHYAIWLKDARQKAPNTIEQAMAAIAAFEQVTDWKDFKAFHIEQARKFKRTLSNAVHPKTGKPLAKATIKARLDAVKAFFLWLADQPGYRSRIRYADCEYFNLSANDTRVATAKREQPAPSLEQVHRMIEAMPSETAIERRDRAVIAFAMLTGARDNAIASFRLKDVDLASGKVAQDARHVRTKFSKTFDTWFFPVGGDAEQIVRGWVAYLTETLDFGPDDPLFPQTDVALNVDGLFSPMGLKREGWKNADAIRRIFRCACDTAGLPYFKPHSIRTTLARLGEHVCRTPEEFKAWSQNLGHEQVLTTFQNYGTVTSHRQAELIKTMAGSTDGTVENITPEMIKAVLDHLRGQSVV